MLESDRDKIKQYALELIASMDALHTDVDDVRSILACIKEIVDDYDD